MQRKSNDLVPSKASGILGVGAGGGDRQCIDVRYFGYCSSNLQRYITGHGLGNASTVACKIAGLDQYPAGND